MITRVIPGDRDYDLVSLDGHILIKGESFQICANVQRSLHLPPEKRGISEADEIADRIDP